jgi:hypothetical protein
MRCVRLVASDSKHDDACERSKRRRGASAIYADSDACAYLYAVSKSDSNSNAVRIVVLLE